MAATDDERSVGEATDWLIRLQEEPGDTALRAGFAAWLAASPANAAAWAETEEVYGLIGEAARPARRPAPTRRRAARVASGIAATALAAGVAFVCLPGLVLRLQADCATGAGEWRQVHLADGSTVDLGPDSAIDIGERRVRLLSGRAYFDVMHDPARPFQVEAGPMRVTDLGTGFDVRLEPDGVAVAVKHGLVRIDDPDAAPPVSERLDPGEWIQVSRGGQTTRGDEPVEQVAAWREGRLIARDQPVSEVVDALRPYFPGLILVTGSALAGRHVTGVYDLRDPAEALQALAAAHGGVVHRISPWLLVLSAG